MPWFPTFKTPSTHYFLHISSLILSLCLICTCTSTSDGLKNFTCIDQERDALLKFKQHIEYDNCGLMDSWGNSDCCTWKGVSCNNVTGHVIGLDLPGCLECQVISPSLGELKHLEYLDLSSNYFYGMVMPSSIGSLINLRHLNLSYSLFGGEIPKQLGNLTRLVSLDLSNNYGGLHSKSLNWLLPLTLLKDINLGGTNLTTATDWFQTIGSLPLLEVLKMDRCGLSDIIGNMTSLTYLDLSYNSIEGILPTTIGNIETLFYVDLSNNQLQGPIPNNFGKLPRLLHLDLSSNTLFGLIPSELGDLYSISHIDLSNNLLNGPIPSTIVNLKHLEYLDFSSNHLTGDVPSRFWCSESLLHVSFAFNYLSGPVPNYEYQRHVDVDGNTGFYFVKLQSLCEEDDKDEDKIYYIGLYVSLGVGFYTGFWAFCGTLTLKNSWRHAYFQFLDHMANKIYVTVAIYLAKYRGKSQV